MGLFIIFSALSTAELTLLSL